MKRLVHFLTVIQIVLFLVSACRSPKTAEPLNSEPYAAFTINRGTNIAHWLSQSRQRGTARDSFFTQ